jgi:peptidoglycan/xylan/chitin deacetylase (PgdA/CDA1 family)
LPAERSPAPRVLDGQTDQRGGGGEPARQPIEIALTFDDLPRHGKDIPALSRSAIHAALLQVFQQRRLPPVHGFVNGKRLEEHPEDRAALVAWVSAGHPLGNHTYSHPDPNKVGLTAYLADLDRNEPLLAELLGPGREREWKLFRYPYLREGADPSLRDAIRQALSARGYRIAHVTIDFYDWGWNDPYARCLASGDQGSIAWLKASFLDAGLSGLRWSASAAAAYFQRPIKHVLMLHAGAFDAVMLDELLTAYEREGARFIPLGEALLDSVYATDTKVIQERGDSLLEQVWSKEPSKHPPHPPRPLEQLEQRCRR